MFKGFQFGTKQFIDFPNINFGKSNEAYNFGGVYFWLDANIRTNTKTDMAAIDTWTDRYGYRFTQATAGNQPRYQAANPAFNNNPTVDFYTQQRFMDTGSPVSFDPKFTLAIVYRKLTNATGASHKTSCFAVQTAAVTGLSFCFELQLSSTPDNSVGFTTSVGSAYDLKTADPYGTGAVILIINGIATVTNGAQGTLTGTSYVGFGANRISGSANSNSGTFELAEAILFDRQLDLDQQIQLSNNINQRYSIY